jgi:lipopolysaccharide/colanic/teichoic acid biosynthesis glycosyltransferase
VNVLVDRDLEHSAADPVATDRTYFSETFASKKVSANRYQRKILVLTLLLSDVLAFSLALLLAWYVRIGSGWFIYNSPPNFIGYLRITGFAVLVMPILFWLNHLYDYNLLLGGSQEYGSITKAGTYGIVVLVFISFLEHGQPLSRGWLLLSWFFVIALTGTGRFLLRQIFYWMRLNRGWLITPTLIVGANEQARAIARQLMDKKSGVDLVGFVDEFLPLGSPVMNDKVVLGTPDQLHDLARRFKVEQVIVISNGIAWETFQEIMAQSAYANGFKIQLSPGFYEIMTTSVQVTYKAFVPLLQVEQARITGLDWVLKTGLDYSMALILLVLSLPLMMAILLINWIFVGRPIFIRHRVMGLNGKIFRTIKFRTDLFGSSIRRLDTDIPIEIRGKSKGINFGLFLYRTGLDKLPQLFDVLMGRMSLVGPRSISPEQTKPRNNWTPNIITVKPGWTGPWAVGGAKTVEDEVRLTLYYIRNWTIWLDLQILFQTFKLILTHKGK